MRVRGFSQCAAALAALGWPLPVLACALPPSILMTLPTGAYAWGAGLTIAMTGLLAMASQRVPRARAVLIHQGPLWLPKEVGSYIGLVAFILLLGIGAFGPRDPYHNLWTLSFWAGIWVVLPLASVLFCNLWQRFEPWGGLVRSLRLLLGWQGQIGLSRLGHWPAVLGLAGFSWFQMVSLAPEDPWILAQVAALYYLIILILAVAEGEAWLQRGEFLTLYLSYVARIAPLWREGGGIYLGTPGAQLLRSTPLDRSQIAFVTLVLASLSFDGLKSTFWWFDLIGQNPLEFTGRSAVLWQNTFGLLAAWVVTAGALLGVIALGERLSGRALPKGPIFLSFLAIAAGYHVAHYLMTLLTAGQYLVAALNDPFLQGDSFLGLPPFWVSMGFLTDRSTITLIWNAQFLAILGAHFLAVLLALQLSEPEARGVAHLPLTVLMVGYTVFGLWLLASPTGS